MTSLALLRWCGHQGLGRGRGLPVTIEQAAKPFG